MFYVLIAIESEHLNNLVGGMRILNNNWFESNWGLYGEIGKHAVTIGWCLDKAYGFESHHSHKIKTELASSVFFMYICKNNEKD